MLSGKLDLQNTEQLRNKPGFYKSLPTVIEEEERA